MAYSLYIDTTKNVRNSIVTSTNANNPTFPNELVFGDVMDVELQFVADNEVNDITGDTVEISVGTLGDTIYAYSSLTYSASLWVGSLNVSTAELNNALGTSTYVDAYLQVTHTEGDVTRTYAQIPIYVFNNVISSSLYPSNLPQYLTVTQSDARYILKGENVSGSFWLINGNYVYLSNNTYSVGIGTQTPSEKLEVVGNIKASGIISSGTYLSGSLVGNASTATTASNALLAKSASYAVTSSLALTASYIATASFVSTCNTASYAITASYALVAEDANYANFCISADNATTASYVLYAPTASVAGYAASALSASYAPNISSSYATNAKFSETASYSITTTVNVTQVSSASWASSSLSASALYNSTSYYKLTNASASVYIDKEKNETVAGKAFHTFYDSASFVGSYMKLDSSNYLYLGATNEITLNATKVRIDVMAATGSLKGTSSFAISASYVPPRQVVFSSINELANSTFLINENDVVTVTGYYTANDWPQPRKARYTTAYTGAVNIGNAFTSSNGGHFLFDDRNEEVQNVKWWGAKGDGITDDYIAISSSLAYSNNIEVPCGRYNHSQPIRVITVNPVTIKSKVGSYQSGYIDYSSIKEAEFVYKGSTTTASFDLTPIGGLRYGCELENVSFDASGSAGYALKVVYLARGYFKNVRANNATNTNLYISASQFCEFDRFSTSKNDDTRNTTPQYGIKLDGLCTANTFIQPVVETSAVYGLYLGDRSISNNFINGAVESNTGGGIYVGASSAHNEFSNIWLEGNNTNSNDIFIDNATYFNSFNSMYCNDTSGSVTVSGSFNKFTNCIFGVFKLKGSRNKLENCIARGYGTGSAFPFLDTSNNDNTFLNVLNYPASQRKWSIGDSLSVYGSISCSVGFVGNLTGSATNALTASYIGSGTNNYVPIWRSNVLSATSSILDTGDKIGFGISSPAAKLHTKYDGDVLKMERAADNTQYIKFTEDANGHSVFGYSSNANKKTLNIGTSVSSAGTSGGGSYINFYTSGSQQIQIDDSGNLLPASDSTRNLGSSLLKWNNIYGSLVGNASTSTTASFASNAATASFYNTSSIVSLLNTKQDIISTGSTFNITSSNAVSSSFAVTASYVKNAVTASAATSLFVNYVADISAGDSNIVIPTAASIGSHYTISLNSQISATGVTGSLKGTASYATNATYAVNATNATNADTATNANNAVAATSASYALSASYAPSSVGITRPVLLYLTTTEGYVSASAGNQSSFNNILGTLRSGLSSPIAANTFVNGDLIRIEAMGKMTALDGYDYTMRLSVGGLICDFPINEAFSYDATDIVWSMRADIVITTAGGTATVIPTAYLDHSPQAGTNALYDSYRSTGQWSGTLDTTNTITLNLQCKPTDYNLCKTVSCRSFVAQLL